MEKAVTNTSSIIFMGKLDLFNLAKNTFSEILIPKQVLEELFKKDSPENNLIKKYLQDFLTETEITKIKDLPLDIGESAAISLCLEKNIKILISDDKKARSYARNLGIETIGVMGIILDNLQKNKIKKSEAKEILNKLIKKGYYISSTVYSEISRTLD